MANVARDMLRRTRRHLMTSKPDMINVLETGVGADATSIQFQYAPEGVVPGTRVAIDLEIYHVLEVSGAGAGATVTVIPEFDGSLSTAHAAGTPIYIKPEFSDFAIADALNESLKDISADGLFRIKNTEFVFNPSTYGYNLAISDLIDVWRVRMDTPGPSATWPELGPTEWYVDNDADTTQFPNGVALILQRGGVAGHKIRVSYKAGFDQLFNYMTFDPDTDYDLAVRFTTGLHEEAHGILCLDAATSLLAGREVKRTFMKAQPEPRRQEEVPVGGASQAIRPLLQQLEEAMSREIRRLKRRYPMQVF